MLLFFLHAVQVSIVKYHAQHAQYTGDFLVVITFLSSVNMLFVSSDSGQQNGKLSSSSVESPPLDSTASDCSFLEGATS